MKKLLLCLFFTTVIYGAKRKIQHTLEESPLKKIKTYTPCKFFFLPHELQNIIMYKALNKPTKNGITKLRKTYRTFCALRATNTQFRDFLYRRSWKHLDLEVCRLIHEILQCYRFYSGHIEYISLLKLELSGCLTSKIKDIWEDLLSTHPKNMSRIEIDYKFTQLILHLGLCTTTKQLGHIIFFCSHACKPELLKLIPSSCIKNYFKNNVTNAITCALKHINSFYTCHKEDESQCISKTIQIVQYLIDCGARFGCHDKNFFPLYAAVKFNNIECIKPVFESIIRNFHNLKEEKIEDYSELMYKSFCRVIDYQNNQALRLFLKNKKILGENTIEKAMVYAAKNGHTSFAQQLFKETKKTCLVMKKYVLKALLKGQTETAQILLIELIEHGKNIQQQKYNKENETRGYCSA